MQIKVPFPCYRLIKHYSQLILHSKCLLSGKVLVSEIIVVRDISFFLSFFLSFFMPVSLCLFLSVSFSQSLSLSLLLPYFFSFFFMSFFFLISLVSHLRLSQREDDTAVGWFKPFYCHNTLPATVLHINTTSFIYFCKIHFWKFDVDTFKQSCQPQLFKLCFVST